MPIGRYKTLTLGLNVNDTQQLFTFVDYVNIICDYIRAIEIKADVFIM